MGKTFRTVQVHLINTLTFLTPKFVVFAMVSLTLVGNAVADCLLCRHKQYGIEGYFDGVETGIDSDGKPYLRICPEGWAKQKKVSPKLCEASRPDSITYQGERFSACGAQSGSFSIWRGGRLNDLLLIGRTRQNLEFFRLQDGGIDCFSSGSFSAVRYGKEQDLMDLFLPKDDGIGFIRHVFRLEDGGQHRIVVAKNFVARRFGENADVVRLYGITEDKKIVTRDLRLREGPSVVIRKIGEDLAVKYGGEDTHGARYCFINDRWWGSSQHINSPALSDKGYPKSCDAPLSMCEGFKEGKSEFGPGYQEWCTRSCDKDTGKVTTINCEKIDGSEEDYKDGELIIRVDPD